MHLESHLPSLVQVLIALPFVGLAAVGLNLLILWAASRIVTRRVAPAPALDIPEDRLPRVLIQLPVYNEATVVERIVQATAALDWPRDKLTIQLLDDSTDATLAVAAAAVAAAQKFGVDIAHVRRIERKGFKAGALAAGLELDDSPFVAIFDADFVPPPDFLKRAMGPLIEDEGLAFVQARWEHLNASENLLTTVQAMMIDAHFVIEQQVRSNTKLVLPFNGTCGVWRRAAIEEAGGWSADALCEDLDLSIRAHLCGWRAVFVPELSVAGELPATLASWRAQQFRWTKGFVQVARKLLGRVWRSDLPLAAKMSLTMQTCQAICYPLTALSVLGTLIMLADRASGVRDLSLFTGAVAAFGIGGSALCLATATIVLRRRQWFLFPVNFLILLVLNAGLMASNSRAVFEALIGKRSSFMRTPKRGAHGVGAARERNGPSGALELTIGAALAGAVAYEAGWLSPLFCLSITGLLIVGGGLARERWTLLPRRTSAWRDLQQASDPSAE